MPLEMTTIIIVLAVLWLLTSAYLMIEYFRPKSKLFKNKRVFIVIPAMAFGSLFAVLWRMYELIVFEKISLTIGYIVGIVMSICFVIGYFQPSNIHLYKKKLWGLYLAPFVFFSSCFLAFMEVRYLYEYFKTSAAAVSETKELE